MGTACCCFVCGLTRCIIRTPSVFSVTRARQTRVVTGEVRVFHGTGTACSSFVSRRELGERGGVKAGQERVSGCQTLRASDASCLVCIFCGGFQIQSAACLVPLCLVVHTGRVYRSCVWLNREWEKKKSTRIFFSRRRHAVVLCCTTASFDAECA